MKIPVLEIPCEVLEMAPPYHVGHPDEHDCGGKCEKCALVIHPVTGEIILAWLVGGINWSVSREDPFSTRKRESLLQLQVN